MDQFKGIDHSLTEGYVYVDTELQRADDLANLRVELPSNEWLALTEAQQAIMLAIASSKSGYVINPCPVWRSDSECVLDQLFELGYTNTIEGLYIGWKAFLTYRGAMIIPRHLVQAKE